MPIKKLILLLKDDLNRSDFYCMRNLNRFEYSSNQMNRNLRVLLTEDYRIPKRNKSKRCIHQVSSQYKGTDITYSIHRTIDKNLTNFVYVK